MVVVVNGIGTALVTRRVPVRITSTRCPSSGADPGSTDSSAVDPTGSPTPVWACDHVAAVVTNDVG